MNIPHVHAELIKVWADGAKIERQVYMPAAACNHWEDDPNPTWNPDSKYRRKPEPKPDVVRYLNVYSDIGYPTLADAERYAYENTKGMMAYTFDGEMGDFKSVERVR